MSIIGSLIKLIFGGGAEPAPSNGRGGTSQQQGGGTSTGSTGNRQGDGDFRNRGDSILNKERFRAAFDGQSLIILGDSYALVFDPNDFPLGKESQAFWLEYLYEKEEVRKRIDNQGQILFLSKALAFDEQHPDPLKAKEVKLKYEDSERPEATVEASLSLFNFMDGDKAKAKLQLAFSDYLAERVRVDGLSRSFLEMEFGDTTFSFFREDNIAQWINKEVGL